MTKPRTMFLVALTTACGFALAMQSEGLLGAASIAPAGADMWVLLFHLMVGTFLTGGGSIALNQCWEVANDRQMKRTAKRPLADGRMGMAEGWAFAGGISLVGTAYLWVLVNPLTAALAAFTNASYVLVYTPMKTRTPASTLVGALPGAIPPMMGVTAVRDAITVEAWVLFAVLLIWQMPHALAIAWLFREDYARGGFRLLSVLDPSGLRTARQVRWYTVGMLGVSVTPFVLGLSGAIYLAGAVAGGVLLWAAADRGIDTATTGPTKRLLGTASLYLLLLMALMVVDRVG